MKKVLDISEKKFEKFHFDEKGEILYLKRNKLNKMNFDYFKEIYGLNDFDYNHSSKEQRFKKQRLRQMIYYLYSKLHQGEFEEEFSFKTLNDLEQDIIKARYYEDLTQSETAKKLGITQVMVSRYESKSLEKMKEYMYM